MEMDFPGSAGDSGATAVYRPRRRSSVATMELAAAATLRLASDYLLASAWNSGAVPDPLRRIWRARFPSLQFSPSNARSNGRPVGGHDRSEEHTSELQSLRHL